MGRATGLSLLDVAILEACEAAEAKSEWDYSSSRRVLDALLGQTGIATDVAYEPLCDLARRWSVHLALLDFNGNIGTPDDPPASPRYTECRLTPLGQAALASERGEIGPLPIGLINGNAHARGPYMPLDPGRVVEAISAAASGSVSDNELIDIVGPPSFPTGCSVEVDHLALASGAETELVLTAHLALADASQLRALGQTIDDKIDAKLMTPADPSDANALLISNLPMHVGEEIAVDVVAGLTRNWERSAKAGPCPVRDIRNCTWRGTGTRIVVGLKSGIDPTNFIEALNERWSGISRVVSGCYGQPLASHIRAAAGTTADLDQRSEIVRSAIATMPNQ